MKLLLEEIIGSGSLVWIIYKFIVVGRIDIIQSIGIQIKSILGYPSWIPDEGVRTWHCAVRGGRRLSEDRTVPIIKLGLTGFFR